MTRYQLRINLALSCFNTLGAVIVLGVLGVIPYTEILWIMMLVFVVTLLWNTLFDMWKPLIYPGIRRALGRFNL
jgi:hypothetical protein